MSKPTPLPFVLPRATAEVLRRLRESRELSRPEFAVPLLVDDQRIKDMEIGKVEIRESFWLHTLITYDPLIRAKWLKWISKWDANE